MNIVSKIPLIFLSGEIGSGKSTVGKLMAARIADCRVIPMAESLKALAIEHGWDGKKDASGRRFLQSLGQRMRDIDRDYWVKLWLPKYLGYHYSTGAIGSLVIVDDTRYNNEFDLEKRFDSIHVRVQGNKDADVAIGTPNHESEREWRERYWDYLIDNTSSIEDLCTEIDMLLEDVNLG